MADQTETDQTPKTEGQAPKVDDFEERFAAVFGARLETAVEARLAPLTAKYNKELAGLRKRVESMGQAPAAGSEDGSGQAPRASAAQGLSPEAQADLLDERADLMARLPDDVRAKQRARFRENNVPLREQVSRLSEIVEAYAEVAAKAKAAVEAETKKPGRDARSTNGGERGHAPASRSDVGLPSHYTEWMKLAPEMRSKLLADHPEFDPRTLPMR